MAENSSNSPTYQTVYELVVKAMEDKDNSLAGMTQKIKALEDQLAKLNEELAKAEAKYKEMAAAGPVDNARAEQMQKEIDLLKQRIATTEKGEDVLIAKKTAVNDVISEQSRLLTDVLKKEDMIAAGRAGAGTTPGGAVPDTTMAKSGVEAVDLYTEAINKQLEAEDEATRTRLTNAQEELKTKLTNLNTEADAKDKIEADEKARIDALAKDEMAKYKDVVKQREAVNKDTVNKIAATEMTALEGRKQAALKNAKSIQEAELQKARDTYLGTNSTLQKNYDAQLANQKNLTKEEKQRLREQYELDRRTNKDVYDQRVKNTNQEYDARKQAITGSAAVEKTKIQTWLQDKQNAIALAFQKYRTDTADAGVKEREEIKKTLAAKKDPAGGSSAKKQIISEATLKTKLEDIGRNAQYNKAKTTLIKLSNLRAQLDRENFNKESLQYKELVRMQEEASKKAGAETNILGGFGNLEGIVKGAVFGRVVREMFDLFNSLKSVYTDVLRMGFDFFLMLERQRTGLAAVIAQTHDITINGQVVTDQAQKYNAALGIALGLQKQILNVANASILTIEEINEVSMSGIALLSSRKVALSQQVPLLAKILSAEKAIGIQQQQLFIEMRQLLQGDLYRGMLARQLVQAGKISVEELRTLQGESLAKALTEALREFEYAGLRHMKTIQGRWEVFTDTMKFQFAGIFDNSVIKEGLTGLLDLLQNKFFNTITVNGEQMTVLTTEGQHIIDVLKQMTQVLTWLGEQILRIDVKWITRIVASFMAFGGVATVCLGVAASVAILSAAVKALGVTTQITMTKIGLFAAILAGISFVLTEAIKTTVEANIDLHRTMLDLNGVQVEASTVSAKLAVQMTETGKKLGAVLKRYDELTKVIDENKVSTGELQAAVQERLALLPQLDELTKGSSIVTENNTLSVKKNREAYEMHRRTMEDASTDAARRLKQRLTEIETELKMAKIQNTLNATAETTARKTEAAYARMTEAKKKEMLRSFDIMQKGERDLKEHTDNLLTIMRSYIMESEMNKPGSMMETGIEGLQDYMAMGPLGWLGLVKPGKIASTMLSVRDLADQLSKGNSYASSMAKELIAVVEAVRDSGQGMENLNDNAKRMLEFAKKNPEQWEKFKNLVNEATEGFIEMKAAQENAARAGEHNLQTIIKLRAEQSQIVAILKTLEGAMAGTAEAESLQHALNLNDRLLIGFDATIGKLSAQKQVWEDILNIVKTMVGYTEQDKRAVENLTGKLALVQNKLDQLQRMQQFAPAGGSAELEKEIAKLEKEKQLLTTQITNLNNQYASDYVAHLATTMQRYITAYGKEMGSNFLSAFAFTGKQSLPELSAFLSELPLMAGKNGENARESFLAGFSGIVDDVQRIIDEIAARELKAQLGRANAELKIIREKMDEIKTKLDSAKPEERASLADQLQSELKSEADKLTAIEKLKADAKRDSIARQQMFDNLDLENLRKLQAQQLEMERKKSENKIKAEEEAHAELLKIWQKTYTESEKLAKDSMTEVETYIKVVSDAIGRADKDIENAKKLRSAGVISPDQLQEVVNKNLDLIYTYTSELQNMRDQQRDSLLELGNNLGVYNTAMEKFAEEQKKWVADVAADPTLQTAYDAWLTTQTDSLRKMEGDVRSSYTKIADFIAIIKEKIGSLGDAKISADVQKLLDGMNDALAKGIDLLDKYQVGMLGFANQMIETFQVLSNALSKFNASMPKAIGQMFGLMEAFIELQKKVGDGINIAPEIITNPAGGKSATGKWITANSMSEVFKEGFTNGFGGFMNALPTMMGFVGVFSGIASTIFSAIKGAFTRAAKRIAEEIHNDMTAIMTRYQNEEANLITTLNTLIAKRQEAVSRLSHRKGGQDELNQLLPEFDQAIADLQKQQKQIFENFDKQLKLLLIDENLRDIQTQFDNIIETYKEYVDAGGEIAKANQFMTLSFEQLIDKLEKEKATELKEMQEAIDDEMKSWLQGAEDELGVLISMEMKAAQDIADIQEELAKRQKERVEQVKDLETDLAKFIEDKEKEINDIKNEGLAERRKSTTQDKLDRIAAIQDEISQQRLQTQQRIQEIKEEDAADQVRSDNEITRINNRLVREREAHEERIREIKAEGQEKIDQLTRELQFINDLIAAYGELADVAASVHNAMFGVHSHVSGGSPGSVSGGIGTALTDQQIDQRLWDVMRDAFSNGSNQIVKAGLRAANTNNEFNVEVHVTKANATDKDIETAVYSAITKAARRV